MKDKNFQQQINDISAYSQINKAFRHAYGSPAAAVLSTLIYKYTYWEEKKRLIPLKNATGKTLYSLHISKIDISLDSGVSISSLEKDTEYNPLNILEHLKLIEKISAKKANKSDRFVLYPNRIKAEIERVSKLFKEDNETMKTLSQKDKRDFYKALKGKLTREEVYKKFREKIEDFVLVGEDFEENFQNPASNEVENSSNEGRTKNLNKNKNITKKTNPSSSKRGAIPKNNQQTTREELKEGILLYSSGEIQAQELHNLLTRYIPEKAGHNWEMSTYDEDYIKSNLSGATSGYINATLEYIDTNIERMRNGKRLMRFGSLLAGIHTKVIEAGIGYEEESSKLSEKEYKKILANMTEEHFDFEDDL